MEWCSLPFSMYMSKMCIYLIPCVHVAKQLATGYPVTVIDLDPGWWSERQQKSKICWLIFDRYEYHMDLCNESCLVGGPAGHVRLAWQKL